MIVNELSNDCARQGDLIFILHTEKPMKTGWYRKVREGNDSGDIMYVFEKPMHKEFLSSDPSLAKSRRTRGIFHMKEQTLINRTYPNPYEVLARVTGVSSVQLILDDYKLCGLCDEALKTRKDLTISEVGIYVLTRIGVLEEYDANKSPYDKYIKTLNEGGSYYEGI